MIYRVEWTPEAERALLEIPTWRDAEGISRSVEALAERAEGEVRRWDPPEGPRGHMLVLSGYRVGLRFDRAAQTILVLRVWRTRPRG